MKKACFRNINHLRNNYVTDWLTDKKYIFRFIYYLHLFCNLKCMKCLHFCKSVGRLWIYLNSYIRLQNFFLKNPKNIKMTTKFGLWYYLENNEWDRANSQKLAKWSTMAKSFQTHCGCCGGLHQLYFGMWYSFHCFFLLFQIKKERQSSSLFQLKWQKEVLADI